MTSKTQSTLDSIFLNKEKEKDSEKEEKKRKLSGSDEHSTQPSMRAIQKVPGLFIVSDWLSPELSTVISIFSFIKIFDFFLFLSCSFCSFLFLFWNLL